MFRSIICAACLFLAIPLAASALCIVSLGMSLKRTQPPALADTALAPTSPAA